MRYLWDEAHGGHYAVSGAFEQCPESEIVAASVYDAAVAEIECLRKTERKFGSMMHDLMDERDRLRAALEIAGKSDNPRSIIARALAGEHFGASDETAPAPASKEVTPSGNEKRCVACMRVVYDEEVWFLRQEVKRLTRVAAEVELMTVTMDAREQEIERLTRERDEAREAYTDENLQKHGIIGKYGRLRAVLTELLACKALREKIDGELSACHQEMSPQLQALENEYQLRKPLAWRDARAALNGESASPKRAYYETHEPPHCPTCDCGSSNETFGRLTDAQCDAAIAALDERDWRGFSRGDIRDLMTIIGAAHGAEQAVEVAGKPGSSHACEEHAPGAVKAVEPDGPTISTPDVRRLPPGTEVEVAYGDNDSPTWERGVLVENPEVWVRFDEDGPMVLSFPHKRVRRRSAEKAKDSPSNEVKS